MACNRFTIALTSSLRISPRPLLHRNRIRFPKPSISNVSDRYRRTEGSDRYRGERKVPKRFRSLPENGRFDWDDIFRVAEEDPDRDLSWYFRKVLFCNRGSEYQSNFVPFVIEDQIEDQIIGYIHEDFVDHLKKFPDVFNIVGRDGWYVRGHVSLCSSLSTSEERTTAVGDVIKSLGKLIPGVRNELYPVMSFGRPIFFSLERAAAPYFGIKAYGVHMNGYVNRDGQKLLWIGKRSDTKPTYPGLLDHLVAGGLPHGISCKENLIKECEEEAGIPRSISENAISVGAISYMEIDGYRYKRDVIFCYDLELPADFVPKNEDGEVDSFRLIPLTQVIQIVQKTECFKPNCSLVLIDFLFRHGHICPDDGAYLNLLQSLRSGDFS